MCDYSLEHLHSVPAKEGATYQCDAMRAHGFIVPGSRSSDGSPVAACVVDGQRLALSGIELAMYPIDSPGWKPPAEAVVTVVQRRKHEGAKRFNHKREALFAVYHPTNDFLEFADGTLVPIGCLRRATMTVLPVTPKRDLHATFSLRDLPVVKKILETI